MLPTYNTPKRTTNPFHVLRNRIIRLSYTARDKLKDLPNDIKNIDKDKIVRLSKLSKEQVMDNFIPWLWENILLVSCFVLITVGIWLNLRSSWSLNLSCTFKASTTKGTCVFTRSGSSYLTVGSPPSVTFPASELGNSRSVRVTMTPGKFETTLGNVVNPDGLSRKKKRSLRYGYVMTYMIDGEVEEVVMGKTGIGRKRSAEKVKKINRFVTSVAEYSKPAVGARNPDTVKLDVKEGRSVCVSGLLSIIIGTMVGGWAALLWLIEGEERKKD